MEVTLPIGTIIFILILLNFAKPNFFNFGTVINNYHEKDTEQLQGKEQKKLGSQDSDGV